MLTYVIVSGAWILFSDEAVERLVGNPGMRTEISIYKGWGFVAATGGLLYWLMRRWLGEMEKEAEKAKQAAVASRETGEKLRQSEEQLRMVVEASRDGLWDWNLKTGTAYISPRYAEITGLQAGTSPATMELFKPLVHPDDWPAVTLALNDHLAGKTGQSALEHRMITSGGGEIWVWARGQVVERGADFAAGDAPETRGRQQSGSHCQNPQDASLGGREPCDQRPADLASVPKLRVQGNE